MPKKISYGEFFARLRDVDIPDSELAPYITLHPGGHGLDFDIRPNPDMVEMSAEDERLENALRLGNGIARFRRRNKFFKRLDSGSSQPVLVSEGDSWFQFPFLIDDVIDQLLPDYNILSLGEAGATLKDMTIGPMRPRHVEYLLALRQQKMRVRAFLFSGAGNDIIGEHPQTGLPMLTGLLRPFHGDPTDVAGHINEDAVSDRLSEISKAYRGIVNAIRAEPGLETLPILFHGYDYAYPYPQGAHDRRRPLYAARDRWLGRAFAAQQIFDPGLRNAIIKQLIDRLYQVLFALRIDPQIHVVDCRGAMPDLDDWADEIHGKSTGFARVGDRFRGVLKTALSVR